MNIALTVRHLRLRLGLLLALLAGAVGPLLAQTPPNLNRVEFFLDTDPGHGLATAVALPGPAAPTRLGLTFPVPLGSLAPGFHRLFIRSRDANNQWSQTFSRLIFVDDNSALVAPNLAEVEHFLDTDPGFGNGSRTALTGTSALNRTIPVSLASLSPGFHRLFLRTRDASGKWSQTFGRLFFVDDVSAQVAPNLTRAEFYFDTDPGFGSGSAIATGAAATSYTALPVAADASALPDGPHRLFVRVLDANGRWSQVLNRAFVRSGCAASENLAENRPAASYGGNLGAAVAEAVFNGRGEANFFNTNTVQADLGVATRSVSEAQVSLRNPNGAAVSGTLTLEISLNGTTFTAAGSVPVALAASQAAPQRVALPLAAAVAGVRAVRLLLTLPSLTQAIRMTDAGVYFFNCVSPVITSFTPTSGPVGTGITITGTNLGGVTAVRFNGVVASVFSGVSATSVTATVPAGASTGPISLTTANGTAVSSSNFTVSTAAPTIASFAPATGPVGTSVTLTGTDLSTTTAVRFNGVNAPTFAVVNGTTVTATVPGGATTGVIGVTTAGGTGSSAASFVVLLPPTVASFAPASGPVGTSVTITGTSFSGATAVTFNGVSASGFVVNSATEITVAVPAGATTGVIGVTTPIGSGQSAGSFAVSVPPAPAPTIASFAPGSGPVGTSVVVTGTNLAGATALTFNGLTASFVVNSATQVTATVPTGATTGAIGVSTPNGTGSSAGNFTVTAPPVSAPTIASFAPTSGPVGTSVLLTGTDFSGATALTFNGLAATFVVNSATSITATVPTGATTGVIRVTTAGGSASSATSFTVTTAPPVPTIATTGFGGAFCAGASLSVAFTASGFASGNVFTAQLSDAGGLFAAPVSLGTLPGTGSGSIAATIPAGTAAGSGYRVRVVGSSPATVGTDNGSNLIISAFGLTAWTGAAGTTNWFDTGNWSCGQLPTAATDVTLPAGLSRYPVLPATGPVPTVRNLTLASGASLTLGNGFSISGNLTNNGTLNAGSSTFTLAGTAAQTLGGSGGTVLFDLTLNNPAGASLTGWFYDIRSSALLWLLTVPLCYLVFNTRRDLNHFLYLVIGFSVLGALYGLKQKLLGVDGMEQLWLDKGGARTHLLWGQLRVFSYYSEAAQFGSSQAQAALMCGILALGPFSWPKRLLLAAAALLLLSGMLLSGTRGAFFVLAAGAFVYLVLSKKVKVLLLGGLLAAGAFGVLKYTHLGDTNPSVYRMRTALDPNDPSLQVRLQNQQILRDYLAPRPLGGGMGVMGHWGELYNSDKFLSRIAPDSFFVKVWGQYGIVGFVLWFGLMLYVLGKCMGIVWRIRDPALRQQLLALTAGYAGILTCSYGNEIMNQMPSSLILYTSWVFVFLGPALDTLPLAPAPDA